MSARGLARLVSLKNGIDPAGLGANPMALPDTDLYPSPHSPLFDFERTAAGAQWIDEIAAAARAAMTADDALISHGDWSARNIRLGSAYLDDDLAIVAWSDAKILFDAKAATKSDVQPKLSSRHSPPTRTHRTAFWAPSPPAITPTHGACRASTTPMSGSGGS